MTNYLIMKGGSLSKIRPIYFGCAGFGQIFRSFSLNLETAVGSQKSAQALGAPGKIQKCLITTEVTTTFCISPCTPISYTSFLRPTAVSRLNSPTIRLKRSKNLAQTSTTPSRRSLILDRLLGGILGHEGADFFSVNDTFQIS